MPEFQSYKNKRVDPITGESYASTDQQEKDILAQRAANAQMLKGPEFRSDEGIDYQIAGEFNPELYSTPEEAQYALAQDSAEGRAAQLAALQQIRDASDQSVGSTSALMRNQAELDARQLAQSREQAIKQDSMRRGQVGGAASMLARQQAAQAGANQNLQAGLIGAKQAALQQLAGAQAYGGAATQLRGQDQNLAFRNADTISKFNMANTDARNQARQANTQMLNAAQASNLGNRQDVMNKNTALQMAKLGRSDTNEMAKHGAYTQKYGAIDQILQDQQSQVTADDERRARAQQAAFDNIGKGIQLGGSVAGAVMKGGL